MNECFDFIHMTDTPSPVIHTSHWGRIFVLYRGQSTNVDWLVRLLLVKRTLSCCVWPLSWSFQQQHRKKKKKEKEKLNLLMLYCTMMILGKTLMFCNCARGDERSIYFFWWKAGCRAVDGPIEANENSIMARRGDCQKQNKNDFLFSCVLDVL